MTGARAVWRAEHSGAHNDKLPDAAGAALPTERRLPQQHPRRRRRTDLARHAARTCA